MSEPKNREDKPGRKLKSSPSNLYNAWVNPRGKVFEVDPGYHINFVLDYLEERFGKEYLLKTDLTSDQKMYEFMETEGWIRVTNWKDKEFIFTFPSKIFIPNIQKRVIIDICLKHDISIPREVHEDY